jgi:hypothetical protein
LTVAAKSLLPTALLPRERLVVAVLPLFTGFLVCAATFGREQNYLSPRIVVRPSRAARSSEGEFELRVTCGKRVREEHGLERST